MSQDNKVIAYLAPDEMVALMNETGMITIHERGMADGKPVIHAALKVVNAQTGEQLPGGLPFSVVMFKTAQEPGYSNIAIGTVIPVAELEISLPRDYFNFCNQRFRFTRVFPLDERSFVLQMDLFVRNATREYVKFSFGVWASMFSQLLFELMGRGRDSLVAAAEAYAVARTDLSQQYVSTVATVDEAAVEPIAVVAEPEPVAAPQVEAVVEAAVPEFAVLEPTAEPAPEEQAETAPEPVEARAEVSVETAAEPMAPSVGASTSIAEADLAKALAEASVADAPVAELAPAAANESDPKEPAAA